MRKIILFIAMSLDGYIADAKGGVGWLVGDREPSGGDYGYTDFLAGIDTILMGRTTYEQVIHELSPDHWPYEGKDCYVAATRSMPEDENVELIAGDLCMWARMLREQPGRDIWLVGGAKLIEPFIQQDLIDEYWITIVPTLLGSGTPLFLGQNPQILLHLEECKSADGMVMLKYTKR